MSTTSGVKGLGLQTGRASEVIPPRPESNSNSNSSSSNSSLLHRAAESTTAGPFTPNKTPTTAGPAATATAATPVPLHPTVIVTSKEEQSAKLLVPAPAEKSASPASVGGTFPSAAEAATGATTATATATAAAAAGKRGGVAATEATTTTTTTTADSGHQKIAGNTTSNISTLTNAKDGGAVTPLSMSNQHQRGLAPDLRIKNKLIAHRVLERSKILTASRRVRTRLQYAILKIRRGWSKYTLQEVESLLQPGRSPRISARSPLKRERDNIESSPRQSERQKVKGSYAYYQQPTYHSLYQDQDDNDDAEEEPPVRVPVRNSRTRMSLSQFTDSELYQPAKSLISIATSRADPGYGSPYMQAHGSPFYSRPSTHHHSGSPSLYHDGPLLGSRSQGSTTSWSEYSASETPQPGAGSYMEVDEDVQGTPSEAQVAHTILMLSSPTRPPPRTLGQNYIVEMNSGSPTSAPISDWSGPYAPSSTQYQPSTASTTPVQSPILAQLPFGQMSDNDQRSLAAASKPPRLPYIANMYGMTHGPSSPSPLSISTLPPTTIKEEGGTMSRSASPTLKRAVRFAAEHMESGDVHHPPLAEPPGHPYSTSSSPYPPAGLLQTSGSDYHRATTPPPRSGGSYGPSSTGAHHGMRTPPPSGDNDMEGYLQQLPPLRHYAKGPTTPDAMIQAERIRVKRRNSGLTGGNDVDLRQLYPTTGAQRSPHSSQPHSPAVHQ